METLTTNELDTASKVCLHLRDISLHAYFCQTLYAGVLLFVASLALAKLSIVVLIHHITPSWRHRQLNHAIAALITVGTITSIFAEAFQCALPTVWLLSGQKCINRVSQGNTLQCRLHLTKICSRSHCGIILAFSNFLATFVSLGCPFTSSSDCSSASGESWPFFCALEHESCEPY